jgi:hypothetical protein
MKSFEDMQKFGKDNLDANVKSIEVVSKSLQAIAAEMVDYSKKAFEESAAATEKLFGAKSLDKAMEVQSEYLKSSYERFMAETTKLGGLYAGLAQETCKPFGSLVAMDTAAK